MRIPPELALLGYKIPVKIKDLTEASAKGMYRTDKTTIFLDKALSTQQKESVLIHEYIEAINDTLGLGLEETQICALEMCLHQLIPQLNDDNSNHTTRGAQ